MGFGCQARKHGVGVSGEVEHVSVTPRNHHEAGNWIIQTYSNSVLR